MGERMHPPENIPPISEAQKKLPAEQADDPAELLKIHTAAESCRACHQHIDPLGLGLEQSDPQGKWRTQYENRRPVRAAGRLPNGQAFAKSPPCMNESLMHAI